MSKALAFDLGRWVWGAEIIYRRSLRGGEDVTDLRLFRTRREARNEGRRISEFDSEGYIRVRVIPIKVLRRGAL